MENWINKEINIGQTRQNKTLYVSFIAKPTIKEIHHIIPACGCTTFRYDDIDRKLNVTYKAGNIPKQISGNQNINKLITVIYKDGSEDQLFITGIKTRY